MVRTVKRSINANRLKTRFTKRAHAAIETAIAKARDCIRYMAKGMYTRLTIMAVCTVLLWV